jgi:hypothetical protein
LDIANFAFEGKRSERVCQKQPQILDVISTIGIPQKPARSSSQQDYFFANPTISNNFNALVVGVTPGRIL